MGFKAHSNAAFPLVFSRFLSFSLLTFVIYCGRMVSMMDGVEVKEIRDRLNLSREKFARLLGVSFYTVYRWERGQRKPSAMAEILLKRIAEDGEGKV